MNRITGFSAIAFWISSRMGLLVASLMRCSPFRKLCLDRQGVDPAAQLSAEDLVHEAVLGDPAKTVECRREHDGVEVVPVAGTSAVAPGIPASMRAFSSSGVADVGADMPQA